MTANAWAAVEDLMFAWWASEAEDSLIYMARNPDTGAIKIGRTTNLPARLLNLRTAIPGLELVCAFAGGRVAESDLHASFADDRIGGEWFRPSAGIASLALAARRRSA